MADKLYPPRIEGSLPAFWLEYDATNSVVRGANITIPFEPSSAVNETQVEGFVLRLRTVSTGSYLFSPVFSTNFNFGTQEVIFNLTASQATTLNEGQYYKVQIAYCGSILTEGSLQGYDIGYFSTVGIIKCTSKPKVYINNLVQENVNFFTNEFIGTYDQNDCKDQTEKVYSYQFDVYDENDEVYFTTGEKLHQSTYDTEYNFSIDKVLISDFIKSGVTYSIQYKVTTTNNLHLSTPKYKLTNENLASPNELIEIITKSNQDNGYVEINFKGHLDLNKSWHYVLDTRYLESEKKENGQYQLDRNNASAFSTVQTNLHQRVDKITFLKQNSLFRRYTDKYTFFYTMTDNIPPGTIQFINEDDARYVSESKLIEIQSNDELSYFEKLEEILDLPYYKLISSGRNLVKNLTYKYVQDNFITLKSYYNAQTGRNTDLEENEYYLIESVPYEAFYYGNYVLSRASDVDNYTTWLTIAKFRLDEQAPSMYSFKDITVEHGRKYRYGLQQVNIWGMISERIMSGVHEVSFEDMFLYDGDRLLKIRFNPEVNTFKTTILEQKTDTIGGRFPYITRNGETYYKEFPIGGLIAHEMDEEQLFCKIVKGDAHRHSTSATGEDIYDENKKLLVPSNIPENGLRDWHMFSDENILLEREFKLQVLEWLNDGRPKLFKSPYEGNYIVRLMKNQLQPVQELGRMLHSFTSEAYEIAECTYDNLVAYGFVNVQPPSNYVGLWRSYLLTDKSLLDNEGNILVSFDAGLETFTIQDMMPGDIIYLQFFDSDDWEPIMIGITGSYTYTVGKDRAVSKLKIAPHSEIDQTSDRNTAGIIHCYYKGVRITAFDSIIAQQLRTIPSQQYIGVNPWMEKVRREVWDIEQNEGMVHFDLTEAQHRGIQEYNFRDYLDDFTEVRNNGKDVSYKVNDNFKKFISSFDPGELIDRINTTINKGEAYKIQLLNIEQAKFRLRDIIPVYTVDEEMHATWRRGNKEFYGQKDEKEGTPALTNYQWVAVSPYGYPHRIEELTKFEMIDPYCIFQVFEMNQDTHSWTPVNFGGTSYYDPYYRAWINGYDPTFKVNYKWKKVGWIHETAENEPVSAVVEAYNLAVKNKNQGKPYNSDDIYDYIAGTEIINNVSKHYYINKLGHKVYLTDYFDLYYKEGNYYFSYGNMDGVFSDDDAIYFVKEYDTDISLATIKEKDYKELKDINSIHIGNAVIAELTFQIKVIDYYTEVRDDEVRAAKDRYLQERNFYASLMKNYAIIANADYYTKKYSALKNAYDKLLRGTARSYLTDSDKYVLQELLKNNYEVEQLKLLTLYEVKTIDESLDMSAIEELLKYKQNHIDLKEDSNNPFGFNNLFLFSSTLEDKISYYAIDGNIVEIKQPTINGNEDTDLENKTIFRQTDQDGTVTYFAVNKIAVENLYKTKHTMMTLLGYSIVYQNDYSFGTDNNNLIDNIDTGVVNKDELITANTKIEELTQISHDNIINIKQSLLNKDEVKDLIDSDMFISLIPIALNDSLITTFYEELELEKLMGEDNDYALEGVENKYNNLQEEVNNFNEDINNLLELIETETTTYIEIYNKLQEAIDLYNEDVYKNWAYNELVYWLRDESIQEEAEEISPSNRIKYSLTGIKEVVFIEHDAITARFNKLINACGNLYYIITENLPKILLYEQMQRDQKDDEDLDEFLELQIVEQRGQIALCTIAFYKAIFELDSLLKDNTKLQNSVNEKTFLSCLEKYNEIYQEVVEASTHCIKDSYYKGLVIYDQKNNKKGYITTIKNRLIAELEVEKNLIHESPTYTNPIKMAELENYYEDLNYLLNWTDIEAKTIYHTVEDNIYGIYNIIYHSNIQAIVAAQEQITVIENQIVQEINNLDPEGYSEEEYQAIIETIQHSRDEELELLKQTLQEEINKDHIIQIGDITNLNPRRTIGGQIAYYSDYQITQHDNKKETETYFYRSTIYIQGGNHSTGPLDTVIPRNIRFIFNPLNGKDLQFNVSQDNGGVDPVISEIEKVENDNNTTFNCLNNFIKDDIITNYDYYNALTLDQKEQVLSINSKLITIILSYLDNKSAFEDGTGLADTIETELLAEGKTYSVSELNKKREELKALVAEADSELSAYAIFNNKILYAESQIGMTGEDLSILELSECTRPFFLLNDKVDIHDINPEKIDLYQPTVEQTRGSEEWAQSILPLNLKELGEVITDPITNDQTISDEGIYYEYLQQLGGQSLESKQKLLEQANALLQLYKEQYDNYIQKYGEYNKAFEEYNSIYNSFAGTEELDYYLNQNDMTLEDYRLRVKQAWWDFLRILDYKYTKEREKGMYA